MRPLETSLDGQVLLYKSPRGVGRDCRASQPPLVAASLHGLAGGDGVNREIFCSKEEEKSEKSEAGLQDKPTGRRREKATYH